MVTCLILYFFPIEGFQQGNPADNSEEFINGIISSRWLRRNTIDLGIHDNETEIYRASPYLPLIVYEALLL